MEEPAGHTPRRLYSQRSNPLIATLTSCAPLRPLSDIKEITETSLFDPANRNAPIHRSSTGRKSETNHTTGVQSQNTAEQLSRQNSARGRRNSLESPYKAPERSSIYRIPIANVPPRASSKPRRSRSISIPREPAVLFPSQPGTCHYIANNGQSQSPVKDVIKRLQPCELERGQKIPSKTIVKIGNPSSENILTQPTLQHPRLKVDLLLAAPLFVGGSSVEGTVRIVVDEAERIRHRKTLTLERVSVDLLGVEEISGDVVKRYVFLALGNEIVDLMHPPPPDMVDSEQPDPPLKRSWILVPSISNLPFLMKLPLNVGPPPFQSKHARIRYVLCASLTIKDAGRQLCVRCSQDTALMSVSDPEKALVSLPSPLTVSETFYLSSSSDEHIILTAGLHRQVWVSGTNLFADVHIINNTRKAIKKLDLKLERLVLCYRHAAAATLEISASNSRMFDYKEQITAARTSVKPGVQGWNGVLPNTAVLRTCEMEIPRGHATVQCHKFFEVRYYLYITVHATRTRVATVQLPIHIIHMNSLDVPTNSVAQVAAAIEEKRNGRIKTKRAGDLNHKPSKISLQGRAFAAPRQKSLERARAHRDELKKLGRELDNSPRKRWGANGHEIRKVKSSTSFKTPPSNRKGRIIDQKAAMELRSRLHRLHQASFDSILTSRSAPRGKYPANNSSILGSYLQDYEVQHPRHGIGSAASIRNAPLESRRLNKGHERWKPTWIAPASQDGAETHI